jgi:hypothetical protein
MTQKQAESLKRTYERIAQSKAKMRAFLMSKSKEDRFRIMREELSPKAIEEICQWAIPEEDYEICTTLQEVSADNIDTFSIEFSLEGTDSNRASMVKFLKDGIYYYHGDIHLEDDDEYSIISLYKRPDGTWNSEWMANDTRFYQPLGEAIDHYESQKGH